MLNNCGPDPESLQDKMEELEKEEIFKLIDEDILKALMLGCEEKEDE